MQPTSSPLISPKMSLSRPDFITLLDTALSVSEWRYARRLAATWLAIFPGDIPVKFRYAQAIGLDDHLNTGKQAVDILEELCGVDPEFAEAYKLIAMLQQRDKQEIRSIAKGCAFALNKQSEGSVNKGEMVPIWAHQLQIAKSAMTKFYEGDLDNLSKAEHAIHQALVENPDTPLAAVIHLNVMRAKVELPTQAIVNLAEIYHTRWPECIHFSLILADYWMDSGDPAQAVELLHQAVANDLTGQVAQRIWGKQHAYSSLWPEKLEIPGTIINSPQSLPVPATVAARLGWNQLPFQASEVPIPVPPLVESNKQAHHSAKINPSGDSTALPDLSQPIIKSFAVSHRRKHSKMSEPVRAVQSEFNRLAKQLKTPALSNQDGRFPVYVIFTTRKGLEAQYGVNSALHLDEALKKLARTIRGLRINHENWGAILFYADDPEYTSFFDVSPAPHNDPWALKLLLSDLDDGLSKGGERIGAVLIVGGQEVVPFHRLPNPVDDADVEVLSDNPYTSAGVNYFVQEWPIGRLPGGSSGDPTSLLVALRGLTKRYIEFGNSRPWYKKIASRLRELIRVKTGKLQASFGYSAAIWRRASLSVFRTIGNPQDLLVSPPVRACDEDSASEQVIPEGSALEDSACLLMPDTRLAYFNLHGIPDSAFWYGHRDPTEPMPGLEFPVAIRPQDIRNGGCAPELVFTEACYGAHIIGKNLDEALSLKFLTSGSQVVIGSTCISYGSISTPLSAADLLGRIFWGLLEEGLPAGEALRRSKLHLVREMHRRQGYLDPEDQKTIISFVLYGDPLFQPLHIRRYSKNLYRRTILPSTIQTVSENHQPADRPAPVSPEIVAHVNNIVAQYLPGMTNAQLHLTQAHIETTDLSSTTANSAQVSTKNESSTVMPHLNGRQVVALSKSIRQANRIHSHYARLTMDSSGKLLKLTVSR